MDAMLTNGESPMPVIEAEKVKTKKTYTNSGHVIASLAHIEHRPTFTDVCIISFFVGITLTDTLANQFPVLDFCLSFYFIFHNIAL